MIDSAFLLFSVSGQRKGIRLKLRKNRLSKKPDIFNISKGFEDKARYVVLLAVPPAMELDIVGPMSVFGAVNNFFGPRKAGYRVELVTTGAALDMEGSAGLRLIAHRRYHELFETIDTLLVVGGTGALGTCQSELLCRLRETASRARRVGSVCTGAFLLAQAGLLDGRRATTHWAYARELQSRYPQVRVDPGPIWVQDGNIYTSAGVTTGMDLALGFVEEDFGSDIALEAARSLVLFLRRPGGQAQFSVSLSTRAPDKSSLHELQVWMAENLDKDLSVEALASRVAMSARNFARVFLKEVGITPARHVEQLRLEAARRRLEQTGESLEEIALACGFKSAEVMRRSFLRSVGITPGGYRAHFGPTH